MLASNTSRYVSLYQLFNQTRPFKAVKGQIMKYSKGKWLTTKYKNGKIDINSQLTETLHSPSIATVLPVNGLMQKLGCGTTEGNANLIASAPKLLEALKRVEKCLDNQFQHRDELIPDWIVEAYLIIEMAIGKAEGK